MADGTRSSVAEAKTALAEWCAVADEELASTIRSRAAGGLKFLPWIAGIAGFVGAVGTRKHGRLNIARFARLALRVSPFILGLARASKRGTTP